jgi:hypothetical protein
MWKLIKYELRTRYVRFMALLLGILIWDFLWIRELNKFSSGLTGSFKIDPVYITVTLVTLNSLLFILFIILLLTNIIQLFQSFQNNNFSFTQISPIKSYKILLTKLVVILVEFAMILGFQVGIIIRYYSVMVGKMQASMIMMNDIKRFSSIQVVSRNLIIFSLYLILFYLLNILIRFLSILVIRRLSQNSKLLFRLIYFVIEFILYIATIWLFYRVFISFNFFQFSTSSYQFFKTHGTPLFISLVVVFIFLNYFIYWFYTRKTDF